MQNPFAFFKKSNKRKAETMASTTSAADTPSSAEPGSAGLPPPPSSSSSSSNGAASATAPTTTTHSGSGNSSGITHSYHSTYPFMGGMSMNLPSLQLQPTPAPHHHHLQQQHQQPGHGGSSSSSSSSSAGGAGTGVATGSHPMAAMFSSSAPMIFGVANPSGGAAGGGGMFPSMMPAGMFLAAQQPIGTAMLASSGFGGGSSNSSNDFGILGGFPPTAHQANSSTATAHKKLKTNNGEAAAAPSAASTTTAAIAPPIVTVAMQPKPPPKDLAAWKDFIKRTPSCGPADGIRQSSYFFNKPNSSAAGMLSHRRRNNNSGSDEYGTSISTGTLKRLFQEFDTLQESLPVDHPQASIWVRFDEETPQYMRAVMAASLAGTSPFAGGLFAFDIYVPSNYPQVPPQVHLLNTSEKRNGFGPNLYRNGKVCLSLLGTWSGPGWNAKHSSLYQVLISIHGLILGIEHPYFLEPGHGGWEGHIKDGAFQQPGEAPSSTTTTTSASTPAVRKSTDGKRNEGDKNSATTSAVPAASTVTTTPVDATKAVGAAGTTATTATREVGIPLHVVMYEDEIRVSTAKYAMLDALDKCNKESSFWAPFKDIIQAHFYQNQEGILLEVNKWLSDKTFGRNRQMAAQYQLTTLAIDKVQNVLPKLDRAFAELDMPSDAAGTMGKTDESQSHASTTLKSNGDDKNDKVNTSLAAATAVITDCSAAITKIKSTLQRRLEQMEEFAAKKDYVTAGSIQKEVNRLEEEVKRLEKLQPTIVKMEESMENAAAKRDYVRAGRLQSQIKELLKDESRHPTPTSKRKSVQKPTSQLPPFGGGGSAGPSGSIYNNSNNKNSGNSWNDDGFYDDDGFGGMGGATFAFNAPGQPYVPNGLSSSSAFGTAPSSTTAYVTDILGSALGMMGDGYDMGAPASMVAMPFSGSGSLSYGPHFGPGASAAALGTAALSAASQSTSAAGQKQESVLKLCD